MLSLLYARNIHLCKQSRRYKSDVYIFSRTIRMSEINHPQDNVVEKI